MLFLLQGIFEIFSVLQFFLIVSGFRFIQEYKNMARDLVDEPDYLLCDFDQQVRERIFVEAHILSVNEKLCTIHF